MNSKFKRSSMKVSDIIKNITEVQDSDWIRFMSEDELKQFKKFWWLAWMRLKKTSDMELMRIIADNQQFIESNMDKPELIYSVLIDKIPKKKYTYISPKKRKKKEYDLEFLKLLAKDLNESTKNCESYYDMLVELDLFEDERIKLYSKYGMELPPVKEELGNVELVKITSIKEHPLNNEIYSSSRKQDDEELQDNIKLYGLLQPIIVDRKTNYIISGNRRFQACKKIGMKEVKVIKSNFDYDVIALINFNKYRTKTTIEKINEYRMMKSQIKNMGYKDRKKLMGGMGMRDYIFQQTGVSQSTEYQLSLIESKNPKLAEMVLTGEISIKKAFQQVNQTKKSNSDKINKQLKELESILKDLYPHVEYKKIDSIIKNIFGK